MNTTVNQTEIKYSRKDYMNHVCTFHQYYAQFVNPTIISRVKSAIGEERIKEAIKTDEHLNNIPLHLWDNVAANLYNVSAKMKEAEDFLTQTGGVCIAKTAAKMIAENSIDEAKNS